MPGDKISVIVPAHNEEKNISECLHSLINQIRIPDEIIIVNDNSQDNTEKVIKKFQKNNENIIEIKRKKCEGYTYAILDGIKRSSGKYIAVLDADSIAPKYWIKNILNAFKENYHIVGGPYYPKNKNLIPNLENIYLILVTKLGAKGIAGTNLAFTKKLIEDLNIINNAPPLSIDKYIQEKCDNKKYLKNNYVYSEVPNNLRAYYKQWFRWGKGLATRKKNGYNTLKGIFILIFPLTILITFIIYPMSILLFIILLVIINISYIIYLKKITLLVPLMIFLKYFGLVSRTIGYFSK